MTTLSTKIQNWAPIVGRWSQLDSSMKYLGPAPNARPAYGMAIAGSTIRDGIVQCHIKMTSNSKSTAGIFFGYASPMSKYYVAQLGAYNSAYAISRFIPEYGWESLAETGLATNLPVNEAISFSIKIDGQKATITYHDIEVLETVLPEPPYSTRFGLFAWETAEIEFSNVEIVKSKPRCFVIMPFREPFDTLYRDVIKPRGEQEGYLVKRVDEVAGPGIILDDIRREIEESQIVVADVSTGNPNVFYELGYAHAIKKPVIMLAARSEQLPFDVRAYRTIFYDDSIGGKARVEHSLVEHLRALRSAS